jgi:UDP-N-acetylmuramoyl-tripeptide--D-alanyl-D-alanine ligase
MKHLYLSEIINIIDGNILSKSETDPLIKNVISRKSDRITNSTLIFFPHKSKLKNKLKLKSCIIVTQKPELFLDLSNSYTIVAVKSSEIAFEKFTSFYRNLFQLSVIGITGTCGKTTTKEMVSSILEQDLNIVKTIQSKNSRTRNLNYLMKIDQKTDAAVIEVGVGFPGGIKTFAKYFKPSIGVITNIETDHVLGFKTHQAYINEKAMMLKVINENGTIILNSDDENIQSLDKKNIKGKIVYFGIKEDSHFKARNIKYEVDGMSFEVIFQSKIFYCKINGFGKHNVYNALAALAVTSLLGIDLKVAIERLKNFQPLARHLQIRRGVNHCTLLDDTWNTNSKSIESALEVLCNIAKGRKSIAVLGDIHELGVLSKNEHRKIGEIVHKLKIDHLITVGSEAKFIAKRALELGMDASNIIILNRQEELVDLLPKIADKNSIVLIKTSMRNSFSNILKKIILDF